MNVLAFDTCFAAVSAAVGRCTARDERDVRDRYEALTIGHAERLLPIIDAVMSDAGLAFKDIDRIAVTLGPGGFTGLRVGIATARALALALHRPVVGISSLTLMAAHADGLLGAKRNGQSLAVIVDARRAAYYVQVFGETAFHPLTQPELLTESEAIDRLPTGALTLVGSGAAKIVQAAQRTDIELALTDLQPHARTLALLAPALPLIDAVKPLYLRDADAKPSSFPSLSRRIGP